MEKEAQSEHLAEQSNNQDGCIVKIQMPKNYVTEVYSLFDEYMAVKDLQKAKSIRERREREEKYMSDEQVQLMKCSNWASELTKWDDTTSQHVKLDEGTLNTCGDGDFIVKLRNLLEDQSDTQEIEGLAAKFVSEMKAKEDSVHKEKNQLKQLQSLVSSAKLSKILLQQLKQTELFAIDVANTELKLRKNELDDEVKELEKSLGHLKDLYQTGGERTSRRAQDAQEHQDKMGLIELRQQAEDLLEDAEDRRDSLEILDATINAPRHPYDQWTGRNIVS